MSEPVKLVPRTQAWNEEIEADIIQKLEYTLEQAKAGKFAGVAIMALAVDGGNMTTYSKMVDRLRMIGILSYEQYRLMKAYDEEAD